MSKGTLHTFGDSFSESVREMIADNIDCGRTEYSKGFLNQPEGYSIWSEILANLIGFNHECHASTSGKVFDTLGNGNSNHYILYNLNEQCHKFEKGDIVIVGFTSIMRFPWPHDAGVLHALPNMRMGEEVLDSDKQVIQITTVHRDREFYYKELFQQMKVFEDLSKRVGFHIFYWSWETKVTQLGVKLHKPSKWIFHKLFPQYGTQYFRILDQKGGNTITTETNGEYEDAHMGITGNKVQAELFEKFLRENSYI